MSVMIADPATTIYASAPKAESSGLCIGREDIDFRNIAPDRVLIEVTIHNTGFEKSSPTTATIEAAPLGVFVDWMPLDVVDVPPIAPGRFVKVRTEAYSAAPPASPTARRRKADVLRLTAEDLIDRRRKDVRRVLPADPLHEMGRGGLHWAGNLNVFINDVPVERHMSKSLRVYPGMTNMAMFIVGSRRDEYAFDLQGDAARWETTLYGTNGWINPTLRPSDHDTIDTSGNWVRLNGGHPILLKMEPPAVCDNGSLDVHVRQRSTGQQAIVEFTLDARGEGPGCFVI